MTPSAQEGGAALYLVFCGNHIPEYTAERLASDMTWAGTVDDIAAMQFESLSRVIEIGTGLDVTCGMVRAVADRWAAQGNPLTRGQHKLLELHMGVRFANRFEREAA